MAEQQQDIKIITVRLPEEFWDRAKIAAHHKRISLNEATIRGLCIELAIDPPIDQNSAVAGSGDPAAA